MHLDSSPTANAVCGAGRLSALSIFTSRVVRPKLVHHAIGTGGDFNEYLTRILANTTTSKSITRGNGKRPS